MIKFEKQYFRKFNYRNNQVEKYIKSAIKDLKIAKASKVPEIIFQFSYNAFIKLGIYLIAGYSYKIKSKTGHHIKIIEKIAEILNDKNISAYGNRMRKTRNLELYDGGGILITQKQARAYFVFVEKLFFQSKNVLKNQSNSLF